MRTVACGLDDNEVKALLETLVALDTDSNGILVSAERKELGSKRSLHTCNK